MSERDEESRFTIRGDDAVTDSDDATGADSLRLDKLSTRITLVAVLIPCLVIIVLVVAYLDIRNRVVSTHQTGSIGVRKLSSDLESRFSSLSLKLARIEEQLRSHAAALEAATAAMHVNVKKASDEFKQMIEAKADRKSVADLKAQTGTSIAALRKEVANLNVALNKFDEELADQILIMAEGLKKDQGRLAAVEKRTRQLDTEKLNRASLDLSLGLERLALQEMVKEKIRAVEKKLADLSQKLDAVDRRLDAQARTSSQRSSNASTPPAAPSAESPANPSPLVEQTID